MSTPSINLNKVHPDKNPLISDEQLNLMVPQQNLWVDLR